MLPPIDYHNHPQGHQIRPYTQELLEPWAVAARARGLQEVAFTDHDRYHEGVRFEEVDRLQTAHPDIIFLLGVELDNDPVTSAAGRAWVEKCWEKLDYVLGSVHYLPGEPTMFDQASRREEFSKRNMAAECLRYVGELEKLVARGGIDAIAHLDLIKIHGQWRPQQGGLAFFEGILKRIQRANLSLEINTAGWRKPVQEAYPHLELIRQAVNFNIPLTLGSDAHTSEQVAEDYSRLIPLLKSAGVTTLATYRKHKRTLIPLELKS